jgi:3-dehydroquinate dehydratase-2
MANILIINGPNLNMLGLREPEIYGYDSLDDIEKMCLDFAKENSLNIDFRQTNLEGEIINWLQNSNKFEAIILNAAAYSHTSIAIMDAIKMLKIPVIEVHISNIYNREEFRSNSYLSKVCKGVISGFGSYSYILALNAAKELIEC